MAARKKRRGRIGGRIARRWFALGALALVGLLYYRPLHDYFARARSRRPSSRPYGSSRGSRPCSRDGSGTRPPMPLSPPRRGRSATSARASISSSSRTSRSGGAGSMEEVMLPAVVTDADRAVVARQLGREPRTFRRVAVRCPFGAPAVTEQSPYGPRRRAVPHDVLPHVPASRRCRVAARGRRRSRALERGDARGAGARREPRSRRRRAAPKIRTRARGRLAGERRRRVARVRRRRLTPEAAASSASTRTSRSRSRVPATSSASGSRRSSNRCWPDRCCSE